MTKQDLQRRLQELDEWWEENDISFDERAHDLEAVLLFEIMPHLPDEVDATGAVEGAEWNPTS